LGALGAPLQGELWSLTTLTILVMIINMIITTGAFKYHQEMYCMSVSREQSRRAPLFLAMGLPPVLNRGEKPGATCQVSGFRALRLGPFVLGTDSSLNDSIALKIPF
jgi:hypothetical protein